MKRSFCVVVALFICASSFSQAKWGGIARHIAMGGSNAGNELMLNPYICEDPALLLINPAYQTMYRDYFWTNIGGGALSGLSTANNGYGLQNAGVNFAIDKEWGVGVVLSYDPSFVNTARTLIGGASAVGIPGLPQNLSIAQRTPQTIPAVANVWEALVSYDAGPYDLGFAFMYGSSNTDARTDTTFPTGAVSTSQEASARVFGFRGGALLDIGGGNAIDFGLAFRTDKATDKISSSAANGGEYSVSGTEFQGQARAKLKVSNRVNVIPYVTFATLSGEPKEDVIPATRPNPTPTPQSMKASLTSLAIGVGVEFKTPDAYVVGGVSYFTAKAKVEYARAAVAQVPASSGSGSITNSALPVFNLGGEWWFLDWLAGRAGYFRSMGKLKLTNETTSGTTTTTFESNATIPASGSLMRNLPNFDGIVTLGLGFRFGNFSLDATVSEEALRRGFGLVGSNDNINSFGYMNASFNFE